MKTIRDPIYGDISLTNEEIKIINTYEMQRLRRVKQLGLKDLVYPGATHTRFEHSIGTRGLIERILTLSGIDFSAEKKRLLFLAALLHDVGHLCFSHPIETVGGLIKHENLLKAILNGAIKSEVKEHDLLRESEIKHTTFLGDDNILDRETKDDLLKLFYDKSAYPELRGLLVNEIDADNLDYIKRDAFHLGLPSINPDPRIYSSFRIGIDSDGQQIVTFADSRAVLETIENVLSARWYLYKIAYLHPTVMVAETMLREAINVWKKGHDNDLLYITGDNELLLKLLQSDNMPEEGRALIHRLITRNLFSKAYVLDSSCSQFPKRVVNDLKRKRSMRVEFKNSFEDSVLLTFPREDSFKEYGQIRINELNPVPIITKIPTEVKTLEEKYKNLWMFIVSIPTDNINSIRKANSTCQSFFNEPGSQVYNPLKSRESVDNHLTVVRKILRRIKAEKEASLRILYLICSEESTSLSIVEKTKLSRSTISQYLNYLRDVFSSSNLNILTVRLDRKVKYWYIHDDRFRNAIRSELKNV